MNNPVGDDNYGTNARLRHSSPKLLGCI